MSDGDDDAVIDRVLFEQVLMMDDDDNEHEFSKSLIETFKSQLTESLAKMRAALYGTRMI